MRKKQLSMDTEHPESLPRRKMLFEIGQRIPHCWFGTGGPMGSRGLPV
jgi:hypothetical protein